MACDLCCDNACSGSPLRCRYFFGRASAVRSARFRALLLPIAMLPVAVAGLIVTAPFRLLTGAPAAETNHKPFGESLPCADALLGSRESWRVVYFRFRCCEQPKRISGQHR